jgi:hypothetical protein
MGEPSMEGRRNVLHFTAVFFRMTTHATRERLDMTLRLLLCTILMSAFAQAQFRGQEPHEPRVAETIQPSPHSFLDLFSGDRFSMSHQISMSYLSMGAQGGTIGMYTNSLAWRIADPLMFRADISYAFTPFGSTSLFGSSMNTIFLQRAQLDYRPAKDVLITLQYRQLPASSYWNPYGTSSMLRNAPFSEWGGDTSLFP